jgi:lipoprotein-releasing system permease protein
VGCVAGIGGLALYHNLTLKADGTELFPLLVESSMIIGTLIVATFVGLLSATVPAIRAARLNPVEAIRG